MSSTVTTKVQEIGFAVPLLPGKTHVDREAMLSCWQGERSDDHAASRRRLGITRESVWIQSTPAGDMAVVHLEGPDLQASLSGMGTSEDPHDVWFREHCKDVHGIDLADPLPPLERIMDLRG